MRYQSLAQVFFALTIILFLLAMAVSVLFGGILHREVSVQKGRAEGVKLNALTRSAYQQVFDILAVAPRQATSGSLSLMQGIIWYQITLPTATTIEAKLTSRTGAYQAKSIMTVVVDSYDVIQRIEFKYQD